MNELETVLITAGLAFLFISFIVEKGVRQRILAVMLGFLLVISGIAIYTGWLPRVQGDKIHSSRTDKLQGPRLP